MQTKHANHKPLLRWEARKPAGGFVFIPGTTLLAGWWALSAKIITLRDLRVWLACFELLARRSAAPGRQQPRFTAAEIAEITGITTDRSLRSAIRRLQAAEMLFWSAEKVQVTPPGLDCAATWAFRRWADRVQNHSRRVPVPRRTIRFLARCSRRSMHATAFAHLLRCMYYRCGRVVSGGRCKATWTAELFGIHERTIKAARREFVRRGWLIRQNTSQRAMNSWGLAVVVNLRWAARPAVPQSPPPGRSKCTGSPPPIRNQELSSRVINQKPARGPAWCPKDQDQAQPPTLRRLHTHDLDNAHRLQVLFEQATAGGLVRPTEARRLDFFAAAEHALRIAKRNSCGLFLSMIRGGWWHYISQEDEDRARAKLRRLDDGPRRFHPPIAA